MILDFLSPTDPSELRDLGAAVRRFAESELTVPTHGEPKFDRAHFTSMGALGLAGTAVSEDLGGSGFPPLGAAETIFELARAQLGPAIYLSVHMMVSKLIADWSSNAPERKPLIAALARGDKLAAFALTEAGAGSDARSLRLRAEKDGDRYLLSGEKIYITSGNVADLYLVFARTGEDRSRGISAFIVERGATGFTQSPPERKMGCEGAPICSLQFDRCPVPATAMLAEEGDGLKIAMSGLNGGRINIAAAACGLASRAIECATGHLKGRTQFGAPLATFQGLQFMLADMATNLRAAILLTRDAAIELGRGQTGNIPASMAKRFATDTAMQITTDAVQLLGGAGYIEDYEVSRLMRDAKMLQIVEGTNQIQRLVISRWLLGE